MNVGEICQKAWQLHSCVLPIQAKEGYRKLTTENLREKALRRRKQLRMRRQDGADGYVDTISEEIIKTAWRADQRSEAGKGSRQNNYCEKHGTSLSKNLKTM